MNTTELLAAFRDEMGDNDAQEYLWSDASLYRYADDAQNMFCRLTEGIEDSSTTSVCRISVVSGTDWYKTSPLILKIRSAHRTDTGRPVEVFASEHADDKGVRFDGRVGPVKYLVSGLTRGKLRAWPMPNEAATIMLSVFRLPVEPLTGAGQDLEIDPQHHEALLFWMKHKAYGKHDSEAFDKRSSDDFEQRFREYCERAKREQIRARRPVGTVSYGGL